LPEQKTVSKYLVGTGYADAMTRLLKVLGLPGEDLFRNREEMIADACALQEERIAYVNEELQQESSK